MHYTLLSNQDIAQMLETIGVEHLDRLFDVIPEEIKLKRELNLPDGKSEAEVVEYFSNLARKNNSFINKPIFLGAGIYNHYIPAIVDYIASRGEFVTAYTPYQAEASQGTLRAHFEFQSAMCELTGMDVSNCGHYDGATALAEAILTIYNSHKIKTLIIPETIHPDYLEVVKTYLRFRDINLISMPFLDGCFDLEQLRKILLKSSKPQLVVVQNPNFFGIIEDLDSIKTIVRENEAYLITCVTEAVSLEALKPPGEFDVDIAVGDAQSLGLEPSLGGPTLGFMCAKMEFLRKLPGRIVGESVDRNGNKSYCLVLQTREQHIRREKATSNICTNQGLMAIRVLIYLISLGSKGLSDVANASFNNAHYLYEQIENKLQIPLKWNKPFFNEFVISLNRDVDEVNKRLLEKGIIGGLNLGNFYTNLRNHLLLCATELTDKEKIDYFVKEISVALKKN